MPGHIMLYLGTAINPVSGSDDDYTLSAISELSLRCGTNDRILRLDRVTVTPLSSGRDTQKTSFIERLHGIAVF